MHYPDEDSAHPNQEIVSASQTQESNLQQQKEVNYTSVMEEEDMIRLSQIKNILDLPEEEYPEFVLAKNKARFKKKMMWYKTKKDWLDIAPFHKLNKLFKQQSKELEGIRANKLDYEIELETGSLTPSQRAYRKDELKMCRVHEKMAIQLISKIQMKARLKS